MEMVRESRASTFPSVFLRAVLVVGWPLLCSCNLGAFLGFPWLVINVLRRAGICFGQGEYGVFRVPDGGSGPWQTSGTDAAGSCQQPELKGSSVGPPMPISPGNSFSWKDEERHPFTKEWTRPYCMAALRLQTMRGTREVVNIEPASCTGNRIPFMLTAGYHHPECGG